MSMIEMACPRCGAGGRVPRDKMNARLVCKKCLQVFHLSPSGVAIMGEPPVQKVVAAKKEGVSRERLELDTSALEGLGGKLAKIKLPDPKIVGAILVVMLILAIGSWLFSQESVEKRSQTLASAISRGDMQTIMHMALEGTEREAMTWGNAIIVKVMDLKLKLGGQEPGVKVQVQQNSEGNSAQALVVFSREGAHRANAIHEDDLGPPKPGVEVKDSLELVLFWAPDTWRTWKLDAKRTAEHAAPSS